MRLSKNGLIAFIFIGGHSGNSPPFVKNYGQFRNTAMWLCYETFDAISAIW
jgi:hypothetical protein